ncbi:MAG TPA: lipase [Candidatus Rifleibacterium sp.]|nr:lipase [Candidatus Rifleibacterium sp.]HPT46489.1 lipase [Candidatus Rifleibacterium sp.]
MMKSITVRTPCNSLSSSPCNFAALLLVFLLVCQFEAVFAAAPARATISGKDCPIVLVHGFMGWGRPEMGGYRYWGGFYDIQKRFSENGFEAHTASVGPISSVHDRACELFWQLFGGRVDYGQEHAKKFGHKRFGKTYKAMLPGWSAEKPVHLIGHSMGGQTIRYLSELLARDFFKAGTSERWIFSITSISTPHNGTTLATIVSTLFWNTAEELLSGLNALANGSIDFAYDFDLQQWGIKRRRNESLRDHLRRILSTMGDTTDISSYDLAPAGAHELNEVIRVFPSIYYMSYSNSSTFKAPIIGVNLSHRLKINPALYLPADFMGTYFGSAIPSGKHRAWQANDGIVNTLSMAGPDNSRISRPKADKPLKKGIWNNMGLTSNTDHLQIVGHYVIDSEWLYGFYDGIAHQLAALKRR